MSRRALILVDIQRDYFEGGAMPLHEPDAAAAKAGRLLQAFREQGDPVVHVEHAGDAEGGFLVEGTPGAEIHPEVAPQDGETVVRKAHPNAFLETELQSVLQGQAPTELVVCGMMTSMCVDATVRAASDLGWTVTVAADACACPSLSHGDRTVDAPDVHAAFLGALGSAYATVADTETLVG